MQRDLSSAQTFSTKIIFPVLWIGSFGLGTVMMFIVNGSLHDKTGTPPPTEIKWIFLAAWAVGSTFIYWACVRLKRVRMDETSLYISNYLREVQVPLRQVDAVTENCWLNIHPVTITFRSATEFGDRVVFMPKVRWFGFWTPHPVVAEIEHAVDRATGAVHAEPANSNE